MLSADLQSLQLNPVEIMKAKFLILSSILAWLAGNPCICQSDYNNGERDSSLNYFVPHLCGELSEAAINLDDETFFRKSWLRGDIFYTDGRIAYDENVRFNKLLNELMWLEPVSNQAIVLDKEAIAGFRIYEDLDTSFSFRKINVKPGDTYGTADVFVQELYAGHLSLCIFHILNVEGRTTGRLSEKLVEKNVYSEDPVYFLVFSDGTFVRFREISNKRFCELLPGEKVEIQDYFRKIRFRRLKTQEAILNFFRVLDL